MTSLKAFILGYTGETGKALVNVLAHDTYFSRVVLIGRRNVELGLSENSDKFEQKVVDFDHLDQHKDAFKDCKVGFCCLGTTRGKAGAENFVKVDRDYVVNSARIAKECGCEHFEVVTAMGADKNSMILYNKTKGEVEESLKGLNLQRLSIFRPGFLLGNRRESRPLEVCLKVIFTPFNKLFPTTGSVHFDVLARALLNNVKLTSASSVEILDNKTIHKLAAETK